MTACLSVTSRERRIGIEHSAVTRQLGNNYIPYHYLHFWPSHQCSLPRQTLYVVSLLPSLTTVTDIATGLTATFWLEQVVNDKRSGIQAARALTYFETPLQLFVRLHRIAGDWNKPQDTV